MKKILVVVDMQNDFVTGSLGSPAAQAIVPAVCEAISDPRYDAIIATEDTHDNNYLGTLEGKKLPVPHCIHSAEAFDSCKDKGLYGWAIEKHVHDAIEKAHRPDGSLTPSVYVAKTTFGCLALSNVSKVIPDTGYNVPDEKLEFTFCGLCTDICVVANALLVRASYPNSVVRLLSKATAGTSEEAYKAALLVMAQNQIDII